MKKLNSYHIFGAAVSGVILLILFLTSCVKDEVQPVSTSLEMYCLQDSLIPGQICYFNASFGDTLNGEALVDVDTTFIIAATGKAPRDLKCDISGKYCKLFCYYIDGGYRLLPCRFTITKGGVCLLDKCTNGLIVPIWID